MRIVHVTDSFLPNMGEVETQMSRLASKQAEIGHEVLVVTGVKGDLTADLQRTYQVERIACARTPGGMAIDPRAPQKFEETVASFVPDIVHVHLGKFSPVVQTVIKRLAGQFPVVVTAHRLWSPLLIAPLYAQMNRSLQDAPIVWTGVSKLMAEQMGSALNIDDVQVTPIGLDQEYWSALSPVPHDDLLFVSHGHFTTQERMLEIIDMMAVLARQVPRQSFRVIIAGVGPTITQAEKSVMLRELRPFIELPARLSPEELRELYAEADVFISAATRDAAPLAPAEAQAAGVAILARSQSNLGERLSPSEGATADSDDAMVEILRRWVENPKLVSTIKEHNRVAVCPLDWSLTMPRLESAYTQAAALVGR